MLQKHIRERNLEVQDFLHHLLVLNRFIALRIEIVGKNSVWNIGLNQPPDTFRVQNISVFYLSCTFDQ